MLDIFVGKESARDGLEAADAGPFAVAGFAPVLAGLPAVPVLDLGFATVLAGAFFDPFAFAFVFTGEAFFVVSGICMPGMPGMPVC